MKTGVYCILNTIDGKRYVGQSCYMDKRRLRHFSDLVGGKHYNSHLQKAFIKYGRESFEWHILEEVPEEMLDIRERVWIEYYQSNNHQFGYNNETGGCLLKHHSEETRRKMSEARKNPSVETRMRLSKAKKGKPSGHLGKHHSSEARRKISESLIGNSYCLGKHFSDEGRRRMSEAHKGKSWSEAQKEAQRWIVHNHFLGKHHSKETRLKISESTKNMSAETRRRMSESHMGKVPTEETLRKRSVSIKLSWQKRKDKTSEQKS